MQPKMRNQSILLTLLLSVSSLGSAAFPLEKAIAAPVGIGRVVAVTGLVEWKPDGGTQFNPVKLFMDITPGSLLKLGREAKLTLSCADGNTKNWSIQGAVGASQICPSSRPVNTSRGIITPRAGNSNIPYVISPRATLVLTDRPTLYWNRATNTNRFTVIVRGGDMTWTEQVSADKVCRKPTCELKYPANRPPLQLGVNYRLVVEADNRRTSAEETTGGLGFRLIGKEQAAQVYRIAQRIEGQNLPDLAETLAISDLYISYNLIAEAIQALEKLPQPRKTAEVYRLLGDLDRQVGLALEAEVQYLEAVKLAKAANNGFELAAAQFGLGEVNYVLSRKKDAVQLLEKARRAYEELGDVKRVQELDTRLAEIGYE